MPTNPVTQATTLSGALILLFNTGVAMATAFGWIHWDSGTQIAVNAFFLALLNVGSLVGPMLWARKQVTPVDSPHDEDGTPLVRTDGAPTRAAMRAAAKR